MAELVLLLFALLALTLDTPATSLFFVSLAIGTSVWKQRRLSQQLVQLREDSSRQNDALHRELVELRRQVTAITETIGRRKYASPPLRW